MKNKNVLDLNNKSVKTINQNVPSQQFRSHQPRQLRWQLRRGWGDFGIVGFSRFAGGGVHIYAEEYDEECYATDKNKNAWFGITKKN
jgi:hypothetical protein